MSAAIINANLALINLLLVGGIDGICIMGELLGMENLLGTVKLVLNMIAVMQIALPILMILNIAEVIRWLI